jgi:heme-degrading monooxygenase HmoA
MLSQLAQEVLPMIARVARYPVRGGQELAFEKWLQREVLPHICTIQGCQTFYVMREFGERTLTTFQVFACEGDLDAYRASQRYRGWLETMRQHFLEQPALIEEMLYQVLDEQHGFYPGPEPGSEHLAAIPPA